MDLCAWVVRKGGREGGVAALLGQVCFKKWAFGRISQCLLLLLLLSLSLSLPLRFSSRVYDARDSSSELVDRIQWGRFRSFCNIHVPVAWGCLSKLPNWARCCEMMSLRVWEYRNLISQVSDALWCSMSSRFFLFFFYHHHHEDGFVTNNNNNKQNMRFYVSSSVRQACPRVLLVGQPKQFASNTSALFSSHMAPGGRSVGIVPPSPPPVL